MQYDAATNRVYVFGGRDGTRIFNDVWALDMQTFAWQELAINSPTAPLARFSSVMIVDEAGENLYIATGHTQGGRNFNDIWKLDLATETWQDLTEAAGQAPEARYGDPGGNLGGNLVLTHGFGSTRYDDTWQFNVGTEQWENITPAGTVPLRRCLFAATPSDANLVIHGGCASGFGDCFLDDTWVLDTAANAWREVLSDLKPVGRQYHSLIAAEPSSNRIILFGGQDASRGARADLWFLDLTTGNWQRVDASGGPGARYQHTAAWMSGRGMLVYGGRDSGPLGDLWLLETQAPPTPEPPTPTSTPEPPPPTSTPEPPPPTATPELVSEHDGG
jgi:N-acetylneuraminic acid mutarotase